MNEMTDPNSKIYLLKWRDGAPYVTPGDHRTEFNLGEAMRVASFEDVDVIDAETGQVIWHGSEAMRGSVR
jgi:hypothetical protein